MDELPTDFDVIVVGTGMVESIVAAAVSRVGKRVLHMDSADYYGGLWSSFNLEGIQKLAHQALVTNTKSLQGIFNVEQSWHVESCTGEEENTSKVTMDIENDTADVSDSPNHIPKSEEKELKSENITWCQEKLLKEYRKFNIDLTPKLLYARGELVELLISSNIARYAEFRCVNRVLTWMNETLEPVPCSRADVFATRNVSVVEKRMLMKLLTSFLDFDANNVSEEFKGFKSKTFLEYLKSKKLTSNLIHYVMYAIASASETTLCYEGIESSKSFLQSLGRYGTTPFLWSMYGCGELPQCFCRLCAVFGGVYCLNRPIDSITVENTEDERKTITVSSNDKKLYCENLIIGIDRATSDLLVSQDFPSGISRAIFITDRSIKNEKDKEPLTLLKFPPLSGKGFPVTIIELGPSTSACPKGLFLVHMTCTQNISAKSDLQEYAKKLFAFENQAQENDKPQALWSIYFNMVNTNTNANIASSYKNVHIASGPDTDLDFDTAVRQSRNIFFRIYPDEEFLPRAPDPEEIVFEGEDANAGPTFDKNETEKQSLNDTISSEHEGDHASESEENNSHELNKRDTPESNENN